MGYYLTVLVPLRNLFPNRILQKFDQRIELELIRWITNIHQRENGMGQIWEPGALMWSQKSFAWMTWLTVVCVSLPLLFLKMRPFTTKKCNLVNNFFFFFFRIFLTFRLLLLIQIFMEFLHLPPLSLDSLLLSFGADWKFFLDRFGTHEGDIVYYMSVVPQLQVTALHLGCRMELQYLIVAFCTEWSRLFYMTVWDLNILTCFTLKWALSHSPCSYRETVAW